MSVSFLTSRLRSTEDWKRLTVLLDRNDPISVLGTPGLLSALLVAEIQAWKKQRVVVVCADPERARRLRGDLEAVLGATIGLFAPYDHYFFRDPEQNTEARWERLRALEQLYLKPDDIQITSIQSLLYPIVSRETLGHHLHRYSVGEEVDFSGLVETMVAEGFERQPVVEEIGDLSVRGGLLDLYPPTLDNPVRIEFDFNTIASIRSFDPTNQRSIKKHDNIVFMPPIMDLAEGASTLEGHSLLDYLDESVCVILDEPLQYKRKILDELSQLRQHLEEGAGNGTEHGYGIASEVEAANLQQRLRDRSRLYLSWNAVPDTTVLDFKGVDPPPVRRDLRTLSKEIQKFQANRNQYSIRIYCDNQGQVERLQEFFDEEEDMETPPVISVGEFSGGFILPKAHLAIFLDHQIFLREQVRRRRSGASRRKDSLFRNQPLTFGDYVVHEQYGIGKYMGLFHITVNEAEQECLKIQYKGGDTLFVSIDKLSYLERFSSQEGVEPKLSSLGTSEWERTKTRTRKAIKSIAKDLLQIYAARKLKRGHAFSGDTQWQRELEASFPYEETADQLQVIAEIKRDMERDIPMDRVICGDVGFGKTEVALRAAFKAATDNRQVAFLAPTTILVEQHWKTFTTRLEKYPLRVEALSRFRTPKEQKAIIQGINDGDVDIVIGTHRLLSKDIKFRRLGLVIVDEEQRFGVTHKERLKVMRKEVDVLTMTATPIPRTLSMSLLGARDLSTINIAPKNRLPVINEITPSNDTTIRNAILRELDRNGQIYFVHNRVKSIESIAHQLERLVPGIRLCIAHGQMKERELEKVMVDFMERKYDCLVSTMIIESGLDIPNVNTILISNAHQMGLSQLYQLRGRVGRSSHQGYAYFLIPSFEALDDIAVRRLRTIREHWELGSGLKVAMRDLEIRGAGNLLGREQSGNINAVGFELYNKLVEETVAELRREMPDFAEETTETSAPVITADIQTDVDTYLPDDYIAYGEFRTELYQRIGKAPNIASLRSLQEELQDRFGALPAPALALLDTAMLRLICGQLGFQSLRLQGTQVKAIIDTDHLDESAVRDLAMRSVQFSPLTPEFFQHPGFGLRLRVPEGQGVERLSHIREVFEAIHTGDNSAGSLADTEE